MEFYDWLLALHLLAAGLLVSAYVLFWVLIAASWGSSVPSEVSRMNRVAKWGNVLIGIGSIGVLVLGVWLAIDADAYQVWDGWVITALVLWAIGLETGRRSGVIYTAAGKRADELVAGGNDAPDAQLGALIGSRTALWLQLASSAAVVLLLIVMIWKPGA